MKVDWVSMTVIAAAAVWTAIFYALHNTPKLASAVLFLSFVLIAAVLIWRRQEIRHHRVLLRALPCVLIGLLFLDEFMRKPDGIFTALTGILLFITALGPWFEWKLVRIESDRIKANAVCFDENGHENDRNETST